MQLWRAINYWADITPEKEAIPPLSYSQLRTGIIEAMKKLPSVNGKRVGMYMTNSPLWAIYDIALTLKGAVIVPIPHFFSRGQISHIIQDARLDMIIAESRLLEGLNGVFNDLETMRPVSIPILAGGVTFLDLEKKGSSGDKEFGAERVVKIIHTSGTTGSPKGVMITLEAIEAVISSMMLRTGASRSDRHLSILPLSTLLEVIGGLYLPLMVGATIVYPSNVDQKLLYCDPEDTVRFIYEVNPTTLILVPSLLERILEGMEMRGETPRSLRFVACGGAPLSLSLIKRAMKMGFPLYQGYGLSECTSVVSLNGEGANRMGSVGMPLPHVKVKVAEDGEILVGGKGVMAGYTDTPLNGIEFWATGDAGYMDEEGYIYITGRKDSMIRLSNGRSIAPEWVEGELIASRVVKQVMVYGDGKPHLSAIVVPNHAWLSERMKEVGTKGNTLSIINHPIIVDEMVKELDRVSINLPEYARPRFLVLADAPFTVERGLITSNGRLRRKEILKVYNSLLNGVFENNAKEVSRCQR